MDGKAIRIHTDFIDHHLEPNDNVMVTAQMTISCADLITIKRILTSTDKLTAAESVLAKVAGEIGFYIHDDVLCWDTNKPQIQQ